MCGGKTSLGDQARGQQEPVLKGSTHSLSPSTRDLPTEDMGQSQTTGLCIYHNTPASHGCCAIKGGHTAKYFLPGLAHSKCSVIVIFCPLCYSPGPLIAMSHRFFFFPPSPGHPSPFPPSFHHLCLCLSQQPGNWSPGSVSATPSSLLPEACFSTVYLIMPVLRGSWDKVQAADSDAGGWLRTGFTTFPSLVTPCLKC